MGDILGAIAIAAASLLGVVIFIIIVSKAAVDRGEAAMKQESMDKESAH